MSFIPSVKSMGKAGRLIIRQAMRDDEHTSVGMPRVKQVDGQFDEVIPIARELVADALRELGGDPRLRDGTITDPRTGELLPGAITRKVKGGK